MAKRWIIFAIAGAAFLAGYLLSDREAPVSGQEDEGATSSFSAVPSDIGALDQTGPYNVVEGWPKDISTLPGNEKWTWGAGQGVFAESPDRVIFIQRGQLPVLPDIPGTPLPQIAPEPDVSR